MLSDMVHRYLHVCTCKCMHTHTHSHKLNMFLNTDDRKLKDTNMEQPVAA